jgi:hypothetical protein
MIGTTHPIFAIMLPCLFQVDSHHAFAVLMLVVFIDLDHTFGSNQFLG